MTSAQVTSGVGVLFGLVTIGVLVLRAPVPVQMCLLVPPGCFEANLPSHNHFWGDSQAAPVFHLLLNLVAPLVALIGATLASIGRRWLGFGLATASLLVVAWPHAVTYFIFPLQTLVLGSVLATAVVVARMMWRSEPEVHAA
jgi:hypothetical protein